MKKQFITILFSVFLSIALSAQFKKDGTPDMRYKANKELYGNTLYNTTNTNTRYQEGYYNNTTNTYVDSHYKTNSNHTNHDNFSTTGNINPYTGQEGTRARDYSPEAYNYGSGRQIYTGPRGGQYYINNKGNKAYVPKR